LHIPQPRLAEYWNNPIRLRIASARSLKAGNIAGVDILLVLMKNGKWCDKLG
jgi:hypothetical protein